MNTSEVLNRAADLIEERGWGTGHRAMTDTGAPICLEGGIAAASGFRADLRVDNDLSVFWPSQVAECPAYHAVKSYLADRPDHEWAPDCAWSTTEKPLWRWNDRAGRTAAAVIEAAREDQEAAWATYEPVVVSA